MMSLTRHGRSRTLSAKPRKHMALMDKREPMKRPENSKFTLVVHLALISNNAKFRHYLKVF